MALPLTRDWLVRNFLYGVDLTNDSGTTFPDGMFDQTIRAGVDWASRAIDIDIDQRSVVERHDWTGQQWDQWAFLQLRRGPVISVDQLYLKYGQVTLMQVPWQWPVSQLDFGQVQLIPLSNAQFQPSTGYGIPPWIGPGLGGGANSIPSYYEVQYKAGFPAWSEVGLSGGTTWAAPTALVREQRMGGVLQVGLSRAQLAAVSAVITGTAYDGSVTETLVVPAGSTTPAVAQKSWESVDSIQMAALPQGGTWHVRAAQVPADVLHLIGCFAVILPLNTAGDLVLGAGVAEKEVSIDALTTRIQATASAENTAYGARVRQHLQDIKLLVPQLRRFYRGVSLRTG